MLKASLNVGVVLEGIASGLWAFTENQGAVWLPLLAGILMAWPTISGWADLLVQGGTAAKPAEIVDNLGGGG